MDGIALAEGLCEFGGLVLAEVPRDWLRLAVPLFQLYPGMSLHLRKNTENLSQVIGQFVLGHRK
jgi:hypothetical protein